MVCRAQLLVFGWAQEFFGSGWRLRTRLGEANLTGCLRPLWRRPALRHLLCRLYPRRHSRPPSEGSLRPRLTYLVPSARRGHPGTRCQPHVEGNQNGFSARSFALFFVGFLGRNDDGEFANLIGNFCIKDVFWIYSLSHIFTFVLSFSPPNMVRFQKQKNISQLSYNALFSYEFSS